METVWEFKTKWLIMKRIGETGHCEKKRKGGMGDYERRKGEMNEYEERNG